MKELPHRLTPLLVIGVIGAYCAAVVSMHEILFSGTQTAIASAGARTLAEAATPFPAATNLATSTQNVPVAPQAPHTLPVVTHTPAPPPATLLQNLGLPSVFANWTANTNATLAADPSLYTEGSQSLSLTTDGAADLATAHVLNQGPYDLANKYLEIWIRVSSSTATQGLSFSASSDDFASNYYTWDLHKQIYDTADESEIQPGEWVPIVLTFDSNGDDMVTTGSPNMDAIDSFQLDVRDDAKGPVTVWLGSVASVPEPPEGVATIVLDNGWISEWTLAMPILAKYGFPAVIAEIPDTANDKAFMSTAQLQYLQNTLGWDISCHTWDHKYDLGDPATTPATMDSEFSECQNWLVQNGFGKASNIFVWPDGGNSPAAIAEASKYFVAARGIVGAQFNTLPPANPMLLYATELGGSTPTSTLDADVDRCAANHEWCIFYGHILTTSTPITQDEYSATSFDDFVAHIAAVGLPVRTITSVLSSLQ